MGKISSAIAKKAAEVAVNKVVSQAKSTVESKVPQASNIESQIKTKFGESAAGEFIQSKAESAINQMDLSGLNNIDISNIGDSSNLNLNNIEGIDEINLSGIDNLDTGSIPNINDLMNPEEIKSKLMDSLKSFVKN